MTQEETKQFQITEECGIDVARIRAWYDALPPSELGCRFTCEELEPRALGTITLPRCLITIAGEQAACEELYHRFFLAFMSAGG